MESNARFIIGVNLQDPEADPCVVIFQRDLFGEDKVGVTVPRGQVLNVEPARLAEGITDYYLKRYPDEQERVGRASVVRAVQQAIEWRLETQEPEGLQ